MLSRETQSMLIATSIGNAAWRSPAAPSGRGWAIVLLIAVFAAGVVAGVLA